MTEEPGFDAASRRLCPDGTCTGIIRGDGTCSECGRAASLTDASTSATPASYGASSKATVEATSEAAPSSVEGEREARWEARQGAADGFDASRALCPDGTCVGVIGDDGRCAICGKSGRGN